MAKSKKARDTQASCAPGQIYLYRGQILVLERRCQHPKGLRWRTWILDDHSAKHLDIFEQSLAEATPLVAQSLTPECLQRYNLLTQKTQLTPSGSNEADPLCRLGDSATHSWHLWEPPGSKSIDTALTLAAELLLERRCDAVVVIAARAHHSHWQASALRCLGAHLHPLTPGLEQIYGGSAILSPTALRPGFSLPNTTLVLLDQPCQDTLNHPSLKAARRLLISAATPEGQGWLCVKTGSRPAPNLAALPLKHERDQAALLRDFGLFVWACQTKIAALPAQQQATAWYILAQLGLICHGQGELFATVWQAFRQGIARQEWASSAEVEAAWRGCDLFCEDRGELPLIRNLAFQLSGSWFLPLVDDLTHELETLDETCTQPYKDARIGALRALMRRATEPWLIVTQSAELMESLSQMPWPEPCGLWTQDPDPQIRFYFADDASLRLAEPDPSLAILHFDLPTDLNRLQRRQCQATVARYFADPRYLDLEAMTALLQRACAEPSHDADFIQAMAGLCLGQEHRFTPRAGDDLAPKLLCPSDVSRLESPARAWFLSGRLQAPRAVAVVPETGTELASLAADPAMTLRRALLMYRHLGAPQAPALLDALRAAADLSALPVQLVQHMRHDLADGSSLQPEDVWSAGAGSLPVFMLKGGSWPCFHERVRAWLQRAGQQLALAFDGHVWTFVPAFAVEGPLYTVASAHFFEGGSSSPEHDQFLALIRCYCCNLDGFPWVSLFPFAAEPALDKVTRHLFDAVLHILQAAQLNPAQPSILLEPVWRQALARFLADCVLTEHQSEPPPWPNGPATALVEDLRRAAKAFSPITWSQIRRGLENWRDLCPGGTLFSTLYHVLGQVRLHYSAEETLIVPPAHRGAGIALSALQSAEPSLRQRLLQRWRKPGESQLHALCSEQPEDRAQEQVAAWITSSQIELDVEAAQTICAHWKIIAPHTYYLTRDTADEQPHLPALVVAELVARAIDPLFILQERLKSPQEILALRFCDPALGTGAFLAAVLDRAARHLLASLAQHGGLRQEQNSWILQWGKKSERVTFAVDVASHAWMLLPHLKQLMLETLRGVTTDQLALDMATAQLWQACAPLPFQSLERQLRIGNGLLGCGPAQVKDYPIQAWARAAGDEDHQDFVHHVHEVYPTRGSERTRKRRSGDVWASALRHRREQVRRNLVSWLRDDEIEKTQSALDWEPRRGSPEITQEQRCDLWCALWFWPLDQLDHAPLPSEWAEVKPSAGHITADCAARLGFVHWSLILPLGRHGQGFDAVVGMAPKPPRLSAKRFFARLDALYPYLDSEQARARRRQLFGDPEIEMLWLNAQAEHRAMQHYLRMVGDPRGEGNQGREALKLARTGERDQFLRERWNQRRGHQAENSLMFAPSFVKHPSGHLALMHAELAFYLLRPGGRLAYALEASFPSQSAATPLRRNWLEHHRIESLVHLDECPNHALVVLEKDSGSGQIGLNQCTSMNWVVRNDNGFVLQPKDVQRINPRSLAIPTVAGLSHGLLHKLHQGAQVAAESPWSIHLLTTPAEMRRPESADYREALCGYWLKGPWRPRDDGAGLLSLDLAFSLDPSQIEAVHGPRGHDPHQLILPASCEGLPAQFIVTRDALQCLSLKLGQLSALGAFASLVGLFLINTKWREHASLKRVLGEFPLPAPESFTALFLQASAAQALTQARHASARLLLAPQLPEPDALYDMSSAAQLRRLCFLDASFAHMLQLSDAEVDMVGQSLRQSTLSSDAQVAMRIDLFGQGFSWLAQNGPAAFMSPSSGFPLCLSSADEAVEPHWFDQERDQELDKLARFLSEKVSNRSALNIQQSSLPF